MTDRHSEPKGEAKAFSERKESKQPCRESLILREKMKKEREIVFEILAEQSENRFLKVIFQERLERYSFLNAAQKAFIKRLAQGCLEREYTLDKVLRRYSTLRLKKLSRTVLIILRLSLYQLIFMDKIPEYSIVNEAVELAKKKREFRAVPFINALLRKAAADREGIESYLQELKKEDWQSYYSFPQELIELLLESYPRRIVQAVLDNSLEQLPQSLRLIGESAEAMAERDKFLEKNKGNIRIGGILFDNVLKYTGNVKAEALFQKGCLQVQDESSMLVGYLAAKEKPKLIYDLCAAPGGKSVHLAELLPEAQLIASDLTEEKAERIRENICRLGLKNIRVCVQDAARPDSLMKEPADCVLADVPCSGLGVMSGKPDVKYRLTRQSIQELCQIQRKILIQAAKCVKEGGYLFYSTCTILPAENREMVESFLREHREWELCELFTDPIFQTEAAKRLVEQGFLIRQQGMMQILPGELHGFFIAKLHKKKLPAREGTALEC